MCTLSSSYRSALDTNYGYYYANNHDSIQIVSTELYKNWWFEGNFEQYKFPRPDYFGLSLME